MEPIKERKTVLVSPANKISSVELKNWAINLIWFTAPTLAVFFGQLQAGVNWKIAGAVALLALWGVLADFFKKYRDEHIYSTQTPKA